MKPLQPIETEKRAKQVATQLDNLRKDPAVKKFIALHTINEEWYAKQVAEKQKFAMTNQSPVPFVTKVIQERMDLINKLLLIKGEEYVRGGDRLHNFRRGAEMERVNMPRALHGYLQKHLVSYLDMLDDLDKGKYVSHAVIDEKLGDILVYFFLQEATIKQHLAENFQQLESKG